MDFNTPDFLKKLQEQVDSSGSNYSGNNLDEKILGRILEYPNMRSPQMEAVMKQFGFTTDVEYLGYISKKACIPYDMAWEAIKKQYASSYSSEEVLKQEFDTVYNAVPSDPNWRERTFDFLIHPNAAPRWPAITRSSVVNGLTPKQAEMTIKALVGGWEKNTGCQMRDGNKPYAAYKRAEEMARFGFTEAYAVEYLNQFCDDTFTSAMVSETAGRAYESVRRQGKIASRQFNVRGYYK